MTWRDRFPLCPDCDHHTLDTDCDGDDDCELPRCNWSDE